MRLLVTRPEPDNARTAETLRARGHDVLLAPLLHIEAVTDADLGQAPFAGVLLTSANGARAAAAHPRRGELRVLAVLAVGRASADAARAAGFLDVASADGDARDLVRLAAVRFAGSKAPLLNLAGEDRSRDLADELASAGIAVRSVTVYRAAKAEALPDGVQAALAQGRIDGVLHFSRRSAEAYVHCAGSLGSRAFAPVQFCLSAGAAEPLRRAGAARIEVAAHPDEASLLDLVAPAPG
ncbi:MAG: uroporphyrinogen-III synthase [Alphaproteobacteria bacterium]|nr:uroporphyrinogen-III synthase [Alphaproteobacteria bacterium]